MQLNKVLLFSALIFSNSIALAAVPTKHSSKLVLPSQQHKTFREWMVMIIEDQVTRGINPRWYQQDCAGLIRFAVGESFAQHDIKWRKSNGFLGRALPAEIEINSIEKSFFKTWKSSDGQRANFVRSLALIQQNAIYMGKTLEKIEPGDLLFFDQGDDQHLMVWTGRRIIYHNGSSAKSRKPNDNGLRTVTMDELLKWKDTRWRPAIENPNFIGFYKLSFLEKNSDRGNP